MAKPKITVSKSGESGNIFAIIGQALGAMRKAGRTVEDGKAMNLRVVESKSYEEATDIVSEYVDIEWKD